MMRPPPAPSRRPDSVSASRQPSHHSFPFPPLPNSAMYTPYRPASSAYPPLGLSHTSQYRPPNAPKEPEQEEDREYESYQPSLPEAQPLRQSTYSVPFGQSSSQSQSQTQGQASHILVPESTHIPRRQPRPPAPVDLLGGFSPPSSAFPLPPPRQRAHPETIIPETRFETQSQSQPSQSQEEGQSTVPPQRVDTYRPEIMLKPIAMRRPTNVWQAGIEGGGHVGASLMRSASAMGRPSSSMAGMSREGRSAAGPGGRGAAELFMASTQQQGGGGAKTNSEKIMDSLSDWSTKILDVVAELKKEQRKVRDQVHDVQTGQKALATREEVVEEITAQLSPALHEFFQSLHSKIEATTKPLPDETAKLAGEKMRGIMMEFKQIEASQRSLEDSQEKPVVKLLEHLISKLDSANHISDFLRECKDLPEALRDMVVFKQSMDTLAAMTKNPPQPPPAVALPIPQPSIDIRGLQNGLSQLSAQVHHLLARPAYDSEEGGRVLTAITTLARSLDKLPIHNAPPPPPPLVTPQPVHPTEPSQLSNDVQLLRSKVDTLSSDVREIKTLLAQRQTPSAVDVADIVAQLKAALPLFVAPPAVPAQISVSNGQSTPALHPPLLPPRTESEILQPTGEYSQLQPTEVGNSQSQTAYDYPTPISNFRRGRSSTGSRPLTEASSEFGRTARAESTNPSFEITHPSSSPSIPDRALHSPAPTPAAPSGRQSDPSAGAMKFINGGFAFNEAFQPHAADVFGQVRSISGVPSSLPGPSALGTGTLGVSEVMSDEAEDVDGFDDIFNNPRKITTPSRPGPFKGRNKRSASNSTSGSPAPGPSHKKARTRTSTALPPIPEKPKPKLRKTKVVPPSSTAPPAEAKDGNSSSDFSLLDPSSIPGGGVLKRSPRLLAVRTNSTDPMYNSDLGIRPSSGPAQRRRSALSKAVKQELIDSAPPDVGGNQQVPAPSTGGTVGLGSSDQPIVHEDSSSLEALWGLVSPVVTPSTKDDSDSLNSLSLNPGRLRSSTRSAAASGSGSGGTGAASRKEGSAGAEGSPRNTRSIGRVDAQGEDSPEQSLVARPKDPAPIASGTKYTRRRRHDDISYGGDDSDVEKSL